MSIIKERLELRAPAKINLFLKVLGPRADGYHDLYSLMARLELADFLVLEPLERPLKAADSLTYEGFGDPADLGFRDNNLALKALAALRALNPDLSYFGVYIQKNIPLAAGLGGGSSDAAAILLALGPKLGLSQSQLLSLGLSLGSDLPFFFGPKMALVEGRGEIISPWSGACPKWALLVNPGFPLATGRVFRELALTKRAEDHTLWPQSPLGGCPFGENDLLAPALRLEPRLLEAQKELESLGGLFFGLSGSGPTFWVLFATHEEAKEARASLKARPWLSILTALASD
ncbi:MAG: 4-(cytidine 5'-diphospho)-2-C-methyl-D-erythritol kinase [Deltaproteobacteria bacterium]|nr:4-(cytidine 5'-diphospho)-2-C-methyl-D-erythritol kinase [Deltaproteobacteria bacterium]